MDTFAYFDQINVRFAFNFTEGISMICEIKKLSANAES